MTIRLASASRIRQQLLSNAGIVVSVHPSSVNEPALKLDLHAHTVSDVALALAEAKALDISKSFPKDLVVGADQILALGEQRYDKPASRDDARRQLLELRAKPHKLVSAVCCVCNGVLQWSHVAAATLRMRNFSDRFLEDYLDTMKEDITSSVGGYKLEGIGVQLFDSIDGDYFTILGLPLLPLLEHLREQGVVAS